MVELEQKVGKLNFQISASNDGLETRNNIRLSPTLHSVCFSLILSKNYKDFLPSKFVKLVSLSILLKVRQNRNHFFKPSLPPKNEQFYYYETCFRSFFGGN